MFGKDKKDELHEKILYEAQPNIFVYSKGILICMLLLGFLFFLYSAGVSYIGNMNVYLIESTKVPLTTYFALAVFVAMLVVFAYIIIKLIIWTSIKYTITESRVIVEKGILLQKRNYMPFNTIQDVSRSQSLLGKIFSVGTITLYSAYDGKDLELKDVSSPKKVEDIIFENMRGTHLRYQNINDDFSMNSTFHPIRPNSDEHEHYRRIEDLDDLELVDAKERKRQLRENKRKAKNSRNIPNYNSNYGSDYDYGYDDRYYDDYDDYDYGDYGAYDNYPRDMDYRDNRNPRNNYNKQYSSRRRPDSHHHQYSGAIKESYSRNPDKYFANNYEEFHQNNLDAQRDYDDYVHGRNQYAEDYEAEPPKTEKKSGLSRFNPFSSNKNENNDVYDNISDEEFDTTINQAMQDMGDNIKFKPSNDNRYRDSRGYDGHYDDRPYDNRRYDDRQYDNRPYDDRHYDNRRYDDRHYDDRDYDNRRYDDRPYDDRDYDNRRYDDRPYDDRDYDNRRYDDRDYDNRRYDDRYDGHSHRHQDSRPVRDSYNNPNHYDSYDNSYANSNRQRDYNYNDNYRSNRKNQNSQHYDANRSKAYSNDGEIDYKYRSPRESRKRTKRGSKSHYDDYNQHNEGSNKNMDGNDKKTSDDPFEKHSRKFRR